MNKKYKFCPGKSCTAVAYSKFELVDIHCDCGHSWCFQCSQDAHLPIDCELLQTWLERIGDEDGDTKAWMKLNTKPCPKCKKPIQKNQGCMHMTCSGCKHQFCWICLADDYNYSHSGSGG